MESQQYDNIINKLDALHGDFREFKGKVTEQIDNHEITFAEIKQDAKNDRFWHRIQTGVVIPVVAVLHQIASHYGLIK